ncbi:MAG: tetratricopeptide repeat protein [Planctomycetota bacterium]
MLSLQALAWVLLPAAVPQQEEAPGLARRFLGSPASVRPELASRLRAKPGEGGSALLDALLELLSREHGEAPDGSLDLLFDILPARASQKAMKLLPLLGEGGRGRLLDWMARRDLRGFRDHEQARARALLTFVDLGGPIGEEAIKKLVRWDLPLVAQGLRDRIIDGIEKHAGRQSLIGLARSFTALRSSGPFLEEVLSACDPADTWLLVPLSAGLAHRPDLVLEGRLDSWLGLRHPSFRELRDRVIASVDAELYRRLEHRDRARLFRRFRERQPMEPEWALREAHVCLFDLADPLRAAAPLSALQGLRLGFAQRIEASCMRAVSEVLAGRDPGSDLAQAARVAEARWAADPGVIAGTRDEDPRPDLYVFELWRRQVPPKLGAREFESRRRTTLRRGGPAVERVRSAGRLRLSVRLLGAVLLELAGHRADAQHWLDEATRAYEGLEGLMWEERYLGPNREIDVAMSLRSGPLEFLSRALEGNDRVAERVAPAEWKRRLGMAEQGFTFLVRGLAERRPDRVLGLPGDTRDLADEIGEKAYASITGDLARFYERIGEEEKAVRLLDWLILRLESSGAQENRRAWAGYLFNRASIAMDQRDAKTAESCLDRYVRHFENRYRDVLQNPRNYTDPELAKAFFGSRLAAGFVSQAVLNNVVMNRLDEAREHCRKAYALEDSPFNRVLYACYLARDKRSAEALDLLARVDPAPPLYYNLACTYALAGQPDEALHYLSLDLKVNHPTRKRRNRQREWAEKDHDLASLRGRAEFRALVRRRAEGEGR